MNLLAKTLFGSNLYGTNIAGSDTDYRSIYLPPIEDCLLLRVRDAWTDKSEQDAAFFSLQKFLSMAVQGQSIAIELLCAPLSANQVTSPLWERLQANRHRFFSKSMHSFLGFAKSMASKYSTRVDRLHETEAVLGLLTKHALCYRLGLLWDILPESTNCQKTTNDRQTGSDKRVYRVCGRDIQVSVTVPYAISIVQKIVNSYGERVRKVESGNIEWKALMHAFRAAYQVRDIVQFNDLHFPLKQADWLRELRLGHLDFRKEALDQRLDDLITDVQHQIDSSGLPDKADSAFADSVVLSAYAIR